MAGMAGLLPMVGAGVVAAAIAPAQHAGTCQAGLPGLARGMQISGKAAGPQQHSWPITGCAVLASH